GSGIDKIRKRWMEQHWQSPRLKETYRPDRVLLTLPMISTLPENVLKLLHQRFGKSFEELSQDEMQTLVATEVEGEVSNLRLQEMLAIHRVDITQMLKKLVHNHFLKAEGFGRGKRYLPNSEADLPNSDRNN